MKFCAELVPTDGHEMKKKTLVPQAQILWFSILHQLNIPGLSPQPQHPPGPRTGRLCPRDPAPRPRPPFPVWHLHMEQLRVWRHRGSGREPRGSIPPPQPALPMPRSARPAPGPPQPARLRHGWAPGIPPARPMFCTTADTDRRGTLPSGGAGVTPGSS